MIRSFTIVENKTEDGKVEYTVSGEMPIEEVAKALILLALSASPPQAPQKKEN